MSEHRIFDSAGTRSEALRHLTEAFAAAGIAAGDARFLLLGVLDLRAIDLALHGDRAIGAAGAERLEAARRRRLAGEPVARILGTWDFWGLSFWLSTETLVPRPDTETLVEAALHAVPNREAPIRILDLGTGSGCILVALLSELPRAFGIGIDRSEGAVRTARANAQANGVADRISFVVGDWWGAMTGPFDLVVSNPPYIASTEIPGLAREVRRHDPLRALDGGEDGLDAYRRILRPAADGLLTARGTLHLEIGYDQAEAVSALGLAAGLAMRGITHDLAGHTRVVSFAIGAPDASATLFRATIAEKHEENRGPCRQRLQRGLQFADDPLRPDAVGSVLLTLCGVSTDHSTADQTQARVPVFARRFSNLTFDRRLGRKRRPRGIGTDGW